MLCGSFSYSVVLVVKLFFSLSLTFENVMSLAVAMYIGDSEFKGQAPGPFVGLDLTEDLYVGAVPDFGRIARAAGFGNGFTGQSITASVIRLFPPALGAIRLSVPWRSCLCYRQAGCLQLSHRRPPEMCGLLTRPRTDVDPPRFLDRTAIGGVGDISSRRLRGDTLFF